MRPSRLGPDSTTMPGNYFDFVGATMAEFFSPFNTLIYDQKFLRYPLYVFEIALPVFRETIT